MSLRCEFFKGGPLGGGEEGLQGWNRRFVLHVTVANGPLAPGFQGQKTVGLVDGREFQFRMMVGKPSQALDPLLGLFLPGRQRKVALRQCGGEDA